MATLYNMFIALYSSFKKIELARDEAKSKECPPYTIPARYHKRTGKRSA